MTGGDNKEAETMACSLESTAACQLIKCHHGATQLVKSQPGFPKVAKRPDFLCKKCPSTRATHGQTSKTYAK